MTTSPDYVLQQLKKIFEEQTGLTQEVLNITLETQLSKLYSDGHVDSLDMVELVMAVEDDFGIEITDEEAEAVRTIGAYVTMITGKVDERDRQEGRHKPAVLPAYLPPKEVVLAIGLTARQHEMFLKRGGEAWFKKYLNGMK